MIALLSPILCICPLPSPIPPTDITSYRSDGTNSRVKIIRRDGCTVCNHEAELAPRPLSDLGGPSTPQAQPVDTETSTSHPPSLPMTPRPYLMSDTTHRRDRDGDSEFSHSIDNPPLVLNLQFSWTLEAITHAIKNQAFSPFLSYSSWHPIL